MDISEQQDVADKFWMECALKLATRASREGEVPVGALVIRNGDILGEGWNRSIALNDPTAHAEIMALRAASNYLGNYRLPGCTLYVTLEPCTMCAGAMHHARLSRIVFGAYDPRTGAAGSVFDALQSPHHLHNLSVRGGVLAERSADLLQSFFSARRRRGRE